MSLAAKETAPIPAQNPRPITRFLVLEAIIASGLFEPGLPIVDTYLKARAEFCFARVDADPIQRRLLRGAGRENRRIAAGPIDAKKVFCRFMIRETSNRRRELLAIAKASNNPLEYAYFTEKAGIAGRMAISWIRIRTHLEDPPTQGMKISLPELLSAKPSR